MPETKPTTPALPIHLAQALASATAEAKGAFAAAETAPATPAIIRRAPDGFEPVPATEPGDERDPRVASVGERAPVAPVASSASGADQAATADPGSDPFDQGPTEQVPNLAALAFAASTGVAPPAAAAAALVAAGPPAASGSHSSSTDGANGRARPDKSGPVPAAPLLPSPADPARGARTSPAGSEDTNETSPSVVTQAELADPAREPALARPSHAAETTESLAHVPSFEALPVVERIKSTIWDERPSHRETAASPDARATGDTADLPGPARDSAPALPPPPSNARFGTFDDDDEGDHTTLAGPPRPTPLPLPAVTEDEDGQPVSGLFAGSELVPGSTSPDDWLATAPAQGRWRSLRTPRVVAAVVGGLVAGGLLVVLLTREPKAPGAAEPTAPPASSIVMAAGSDAATAPAAPPVATPATADAAPPPTEPAAKPTAPERPATVKAKSKVTAKAKSTAAKPKRPNKTGAKTKRSKSSKTAAKKPAPTRVTK